MSVSYSCLRTSAFCANYSYYFIIIHNVGQACQLLRFPVYPVNSPPGARHIAPDSKKPLHQLFLAPACIRKPGACAPGFCETHCNSTLAILGSKQQVGRTQTMRTPLARCGPTFMNVAITLVSPRRPNGPIFASFTLRVISRSISDWTSYFPSTCAWSIMDVASK